MSWKVVTLTGDDVAKLRHYTLQDEFEAVFTATGAPRTAAMFSNHEGHRKYFYFFSPAAADIFSVGLAKWAAADGNIPSREDASLLVGHADAWDTLP